MIMNSLCALALGFVLDMILGDPGGKSYPTNAVKRLVKLLENALKKAYLDSPEAQNMAGIMLVVMTLLICLGVSVAVLFLCYKISVIMGIIAEGILCWLSMSGRDLRRNLQSIFRSVRANNVSSARRYLKHITDRDVDELDAEGCAKCAVETAAENSADLIIGPMFWACLCGGLGAVFCRCVNTMDNAVGFKDDEHIHFGKVAAKLDDVVMFIPARLAAMLMRWDAAFLKLDKKGADEIYTRDKKHSPSPNSGCTLAACAGALNIRLGGDESRNGVTVHRQKIGDNIHPITADEVFWVNQLVTGVSAGGMLLAAFMRVAAYLISMQLVKFL